MKILVCFKVLPDFDQVIDAEWDSFTLESDLSYVKRVFNTFDESALEVALRLQDALRETGVDVACTALTLGAAPLAQLTKTLYAVGFARVQVLEDAAPEFAPQRTAALIAAFARGEGYDLILTGRQAGMADSGLVPPMLAEALGVPCVTEAETVEWLNGHENAVSITRTGDFGKEQLDLRLPLLAAIGNSPVTALRAATLREQLAAGKRSVEAQPAGGEANTAAPTFHREKSEKHCRFLPGENAAAMAAQLYEETIKGRATP